MSFVRTSAPATSADDETRRVFRDIVTHGSMRGAPQTYADALTALDENSLGSIKGLPADHPEQIYRAKYEQMIAWLAEPVTPDPSSGVHDTQNHGAIGKPSAVAKALAFVKNAAGALLPSVRSTLDTIVKTFDHTG